MSHTHKREIHEHIHTRKCFSRFNIAAQACLSDRQRESWAFSSLLHMNLSECREQSTASLYIDTWLPVSRVRESICSTSQRKEANVECRKGSYIAAAKASGLLYSSPSPVPALQLIFQQSYTYTRKYTHI